MGEEGSDTSIAKLIWYRTLFLQFDFGFLFLLQLQIQLCNWNFKLFLKVKHFSVIFVLNWKSCGHKYTYCATLIKYMLQALTQTSCMRTCVQNENWCTCIVRLYARLYVYAAISWLCWQPHCKRSYQHQHLQKFYSRWCWKRREETKTDMAVIKAR